MRHISGDIYTYRGVTISKHLGGWWTEQSLAIYKTLKDAENGIKKNLDGTHTAEPKILGYAEYENGNWFLTSNS